MQNILVKIIKSSTYEKVISRWWICSRRRSNNTILYSIAEALQQGNDPREILNALKQNGVPEEQAMELIKYVMEQMQQQDQLQKKKTTIRICTRW